MSRLLYVLSLLLYLSCTSDRDIPSVQALPSDYKLIHYWNFNNLPTGTLGDVFSTVSMNTPAILSYTGSGAGYADSYSPGTTLNARNGDAEGTGIRFRNPSDTRSVMISASTVGYKNIVIQFPTYRTNSGANTQTYLYSVNGTTFTQLSVLDPNVEPSYGLVTLDLSAITAANNNPNFKFKIQFSGSNASGTSGNNRLDNLTIEGLPN